MQTRVNSFCKYGRCLSMAFALTAFIQTGCDTSSGRQTRGEDREIIFSYPQDLTAPSDIPPTSIVSNSDKDGQKPPILRLGKSDWYEGHFYGWQASLENKIAGNTERLLFHSGQSNGVMFEFYERGFNDASAEIENRWNSASRSGVSHETLVSYAQRAIAEITTERESRFVLEVNKHGKIGERD
ncbi:hypothetical protein Plim_1601 [Planctopirus limnophila DSM 3776]|uniref:Lipoprotein n=1 Tax=Planctopirus limnophila (strain ATCC 43296 / DSM 3776 / IFAM 1008 / Mu 290) TaxID=521674 RepID=D5SWT4_PLAL2|nr:hypothetical protein [Planctopirus limnophila]ADG67434.1 hypothetical protein Plim_1601 [Planctopirus limnophila DSM 3776]